jgi:hypothetical protein
MLLGARRQGLLLAQEHLSVSCLHHLASHPPFNIIGVRNRVAVRFVFLSEMPSVPQASSVGFLLFGYHFPILIFLISAMLLIASGRDEPFIFRRADLLINGS